MIWIVGLLVGLLLLLVGAFLIALAVGERRELSVGNFLGRAVRFCWIMSFVWLTTMIAMMLAWSWWFAAATLPPLLMGLVIFVGTRNDPSYRATPSDPGEADSTVSDQVESGRPSDPEVNSLVAELHEAVQFRSVDETRRLLAEGADIDARDNQGRTPLFLAWRTDVVKLLIESGADVNARDSHGRTALDYVLSHRRAEAARLIIENGADVNARDAEGRPILMSMLYTMNIEGLQVLIENGADIDAKEDRGLSALVFAACRGWGDVVQLLIENGADVNARDCDDGWTPLMSLAIQDHANPETALFVPWQNLRLLIDNDADVNATNRDGMTALMAAASSGHPDPVKLLIENGADVNARDSSGRTALKYAAKKGHAEVVNLLTEHGAAQNPVGREGSR